MHHRKKRTILSAALITLTAAFAFVGCGGKMGSPGGLQFDAKMAPEASLGVTQGGAQDIDHARKKIEENRVPRPESILTEGLFSEFDLGLDGPATKQLIALNPGTGMLRDASGKPHYIVQVGMSSNLTEATFKRRPLNLSLVIDVSGSMAGEKIAAARHAASKVVSSMKEGDYLSLVTFNDDADVEVGETRMGSRSAREDFEDAIDDIEDGGGTDIEEGMVEGFDEIEDNLDRKGYEHRLILITDARPNTGRHGTHDFLRLCERWADKGVGVTAIGLGMNFGVELATEISNIKGGNYRFVPDAKKLRTLFEEDFDFMVTPLAYDMKMKMEVAKGYRIKAVHGVPGWEEGDDLAEVKVSTLFLSKNKGAMAVEIEPFGAEALPEGSQIDLLKLQLSYQPIGGKAVKNSIYASISQPGEKERAFFSQPGVAKTAALAFSADAMRNACRAWHEGRKAEAAAHMETLPELVEEVARRINAPELLGHAKLVRRLQTMVDPSKTVKSPTWHQTKPDEERKGTQAPKRKLKREPIRW